MVCLGDYIYAETYHTQGRGTARARRQDRPPPADGLRQRLPRRAHAGRLPRQVLALPLGPVAAQDAREVPDGHRCGTTTRSRTTTRAAPTDGGLPADEQVLQRRAQARRLPGVLRVDADLRAGERQPHLPHAARSAATSTCSSWTSASTAPTSPATTPSSRRATDWTSRATSSGRTQMDFVKNALRDLEGQLEDHGQRGDDHADQGRSAAATTRSTAGRATRRSARSCWPTSATGDQGRRLRHRRHPHVHRRRRAHGHGRRRDRRAGVRRRLDHVAGPGRDRPRRRRRRDDQGQRREPRRRPGDHRRAARDQPVGRQRGLRPPRLRRVVAVEVRASTATSCAWRPSRRRRPRRCRRRASPTRSSAGQTSIKGQHGPAA